MNIKINITPQSKDFIQRLERSVENYPKLVDEALGVMATTTAKTLRKNILSQTNFETIPLSPRWAARKKKENLDPRILIATQKYVNSILPEKAGKSEWGVKANFERAKDLEYGVSGRHVGRKHWTPFMMKFMKEDMPRIFITKVLYKIFGKGSVSVTGIED